MTPALIVVESAEHVRLSAWIDVVRLWQRLSRSITVLIARRGMTLPQFDVLATLRHGEDLTQNELASRLLVTKGNVCQVLDRLEQVKWVERRPDKMDGRAKRIRLTAAGRRKIDGVLPAHHERVLKSMRRLGDADVRALRRAIRAWELEIPAE